MNYLINFACGHKGVRSIFGNSFNRDKRIQWLNECGLCKDCLCIVKKRVKEKGTSLDTEVREFLHKKNKKVIDNYAEA